MTERSAVFTIPANTTVVGYVLSCHSRTEDCLESARFPTSSALRITLPEDWPSEETTIRLLAQSSTGRRRRIEPITLPTPKEVLDPRTNAGLVATILSEYALANQDLPQPPTTIQHDLQLLAGILTSPHSPHLTVQDLRRRLGLCEEGDGHWGH